MSIKQFMYLACAVPAFLVYTVMAVSIAWADSPWLTNTPIGTVEEEMVLQSSGPGNGANFKEFNAGPGLERMRSISFSDGRRSSNSNSRWISSDNGQTWTEMPEIASLLSEDIEDPDDWKQGFTNCLMAYDPTSGALVRPSYIDYLGGGNYTYTFYTMSFDGGMTWSDAKQMKYETGPDLDPENPLDSSWISKNICQRPKNMTVTSDGTIIMAVGSVPAEGDPLENPRFAALNFVGTWNATAQDYDWAVGDSITVSEDLSGRGLIEVVTAELNPGEYDTPKILSVWRGVDTDTTDGHKWYSVSEDGGLTPGTVTELKYDDGTSFYSPSSMSQLIRSEWNGKLYWIGNITPDPPDRNSPRHLLAIAEVDEDLVALKKDTVTAIVEKTEDQEDSVEFSNFSVVENKETHELEIYVSDTGALSSSFDTSVYPSRYDYDAYCYTLSLFPEAGDANGDGVVDGSDATILANYWQASTDGISQEAWAMGDFNLDGLVDGSDATLLANYWQTGTSSSDATVPEPSTGVLLVSILLLVGYFTKRRNPA